MKEANHKTHVLLGCTNNEVSKVVKVTIRKFNGGCHSQTRDDSEMIVGMKFESCMMNHS